MSKLKPVPQRPVVPTSRLVWDDVRLSALNNEQLANLLSNLPAQLEIGRITEETASDLEQRIRSRLPAPRGQARRKREVTALAEGIADDHNGIAAEK